MLKIQLKNNSGTITIHFVNLILQYLFATTYISLI